MPGCNLLLFCLLSVVVKSIIMDRIQSRSKKLRETLEKTYKLEPEKLVVLRMNEEQLIKAYNAASLPHLKTIEVIYLANGCMYMSNNYQIIS